MPDIDVAGGRTRFCVLIPSRGRPHGLLKSLRRMPWLNHPDTLILVEAKEWNDYFMVRREFLNITYFGFPEAPFHNPEGSVAVAREQLRKLAVENPFHQFHHYIVTDDNAIHESEGALHHLVRATAEYPDQPAVVAGMHNTAPHFDRGKIKFAKTIHGLRTYPTVAMIFQCYPDVLYRRYAYPPDAFGLDDRHFFLWCIDQGVRTFRVCMDARFTKSRYQEGGQGSIEERMVKNGRAIARLAGDFPRLVGATGTLRIPWQFLLKMQSGTAVASRLPGGAMRKEEDIITQQPASSQRAVRVRVRKHAN